MTAPGSGVRNLRAMFESSSATSSPEPRGRSPANNIATPDESRPTGKVRASFVAVEPNIPIAKDLGTTKNVPEGLNSPLAQRRGSFSLGGDLGEDTAAELKKVVSDEKEERKASIDVPEAVPEQAVEDRESSRAPPLIRDTAPAAMGLGTILKGHDFSEPEAPVAQKTKAEEPAVKTLEKPEAVPEEAKEQPKEQPKELPKELPKKQPEEQPKEQPEEQPKEQSKEQLKEQSKEQPKEQPTPLDFKDEPADNPDKAMTGAQVEASLQPADPKDESAVSGGEALHPTAEVLPSSSAAVATPSTPKPPSSPLKAKVNGSASTPGTSDKVPNKPAAISTAKAPVAKVTSTKTPLSKSPTVVRTPRTPTASKPVPSATSAKSPAPAKVAPKAPVSKEQPKASVPKEQPKAAVPKEQPKVSAPKASRASLRPSTSATAPAASSKPKAPVENKKPASKTSPASAPKESTSTSPGGFKKPRPKSPTRPVRLPSHLTAPTASSAAKHDEEASKPVARKPSTAPRSAAPRPASAARKPISRPSLTPSTAPGKRPESRASTKGAADEGFLARMMRPTAASSSKTHDKPASPPRRTGSVKTPVKPKSAHESVVAKGKRKVGEVAAKAKDAVTHGQSEETKAESSAATEPAASNGGTAEEPAEISAQTERESTPGEQVESSTLELETPNFEGQAIR